MAFRWIRNKILNFLRDHKFECYCHFVEFFDKKTCHHHWKRQRLGGSPDMAESYEVVEFCVRCGDERQDE
jgi:hypothetical protein